MKRSALAMACIALAALCGAAQAQTLAYTARQVNVRAGPARDYPVVAVLPAGFQVSVQGCLSTYTWCDVLAGTARGWVYAGNIVSYGQNTYAPLLTWGPVIGVTILGFVIDDYWTQHYWNRPWYPERRRWYDHPLPPPRPHVRPDDGRPRDWRPNDGRPRDWRPNDGRPRDWHPGDGRPPAPDGTPRPPRPRGPEGVPLEPRPHRPAPGQAQPGVVPVPPGQAQPHPQWRPGEGRPRPHPGAAAPRPGVAPAQPAPPRPAGERPGRRDNSGWGQPQNP
ncbi:SH3 domain-containing protein [Ramlibacter sp.]|uniref:SH3 domain-containing protein n=1 Tax=Ramlibacter sp. TaxID=1917967 RepID=UPI002D13E595|nr:SH3 domain-containing protein [Ramlibacter sp.]HWI82445.1 SH3 domain-containing protein [Ramlibacter sp.]